MAVRLRVLAALVTAACGSLWLVSGQDQVEPPAEPPAAGFAGLPPLDQLLAPVALYPDPILALILPAATQPKDLAAAARLGRTEEIDRQPWDPAVKGLAHYPEVIRWMADNPAWSQQLGAAFADQPDEVMDAVQDLRRRAMTAGTLWNDAHQLVSQGRAGLSLFPAETDRLYLPQYEPRGIYLSARGADHIMTWSEPLPAGPWLIYSPMWRQHALWTGEWYALSRRHGSWRAGIGASAGGGFSFGAEVMGRAHAWHLADNAQIRNSHIQWGGRGNSVLPARPRYRSRATFEGDEPREPAP